MKRNRSKRNKVTTLFLLVTAAAVLVYFVANYFVEKRGTDEVVARINKSKIYKSEIDQKIKEIFAASETDVEVPTIDNLPVEVIETFAKEIYLEKELALRAKRAGILKKQDVKNKIKNSENKIIINAYLESVINEKISDEKVREKYVELTSEIAGKKEIDFAQIVVSDKDKAEKIYKELTDKKARSRLKFSDVAKKYSIDEDTSSKGGELGYVLEDNVAKEVFDAMTQLKKGEISKPIQGKENWYIVKINDLREVKAMPFESVKDDIREQLIKGETSAIYNDIFNGAKVKIFIEKKEEIKNEEQSQSENDSALQDAGVEKEGSKESK